MEVDEKSVKVDLGMDLKGVEGKSIVNGEFGLERELQGSRKLCKELEDRCMQLELDVDKGKSKFELLEGKFCTLEVEKIRIEDEVKGLKKRNTELEERVSQFEKENNNVGGEKSTGNVVDLTEGKDVEDNVILMIENKVLECEKKRAESEAEVWKLKCREMESRVLELEKENLVWRGGQSQLAGTMKSQPRTEQTTKASDFKDGFYVVTGSGNSDAQDKMVNNSETVHAAIGISSICCSPLKGTPMIDMPSKQFKQVDGRKRGFVFEAVKEHGSPVRKQLEFREEGSLSKKLAPSTPGVARPFGVIDVSDSEDEVANINVYMPHSESQLSRMAHVSTNFSPGETTGDGNKKISQDNFKRTLLEQSDEEDMNGYTGNFPSISTPKRKRASNIVTTDSESDSDDNIPICKLKTKHVRDLSHDAVDSHSNSFSVTDPLSEEKIGESATPRRRLVALRECNVKKGPKQDSPSNANNGGANYNSGMPTNGGVENEEMEEDELESDTEGESLGGFIVDDSDVSEGNDGSSASSDVSDDDADFDEVISRIHRGRDLKVKWEFEADMLAAFGKDLGLCMKAVCALYRQQTAEERFSKGTLYSNQRGFSQCDALRGTIVAEFLTDGDPKGDLKKSAEELRELFAECIFLTDGDPKGDLKIDVSDRKAPELCRTLATHYSKQLFAIYKNKEDPLFLPS